MSHMKVVSFLSQKGGSGKTTLAVHTAVAALEAGRRVVIIDTDPQNSATVWANAREGAAPMVATASPSELEHALALARKERMDVVIIDAAPHAAAEASQIARASNLVVIPCRPSVFDVAAAESAVRIVRAAKAKAVFVLSACPPRAPEIDSARSALLVYKLPIAPLITDRRAFSRALAGGQSVTEFEAHGRAAAEIRALWKFLEKH